MIPSTLTISIVTYHPDLALLERCLGKLATALHEARQAGMLRATNVALIDNTESRATAEAVVKLGQACFRTPDIKMSYLHGHANIGYGTAHNLVMHGGNTHYHLVLNPDVEVAPDAVLVMLRYLHENPDVGVVVPAVFSPEGRRAGIPSRSR